MKRFLSLFLALVLLVAFLPTTVNANTNTVDLAEINSQFQQLKTEYEIEESNINNIPDEDILEFNSLDEFEEFVIELQKPQNFEQVINVSNFEEVPSSDINLLANGSHVINWWAPFSGWGMTGLACWRNIAFEYKYNFVGGKPRFSSVSNIDSYLTGINVTWWQQKTKSYNFATTSSYRDTAKIKVNGNYVLGVAVKGFNIGITIPGTWNGSLRLK